MENNDLLQKLKEWRRITADRERVALFQVFQNKVLEDIAKSRPATKEDLLAIKGIKERKFEKYGKDILVIISNNRIGAEFFASDLEQSEKQGSAVKAGFYIRKIADEKPFSVSNYLNLLNEQLYKQKARVQGEISSLDIRENYLFFSLKDRDSESMLNCFMWNNNYKLCGVSFEAGMEIIIDGFPEVYKPSGRLSFKVSVAELVGEGVLKKAYDQLKNKLEAEGLFLPERKKLIPEFCQKIGLITSETGEVIHDFSTNLGRFGYQIKFVDSRVEGQAAVQDLVSAIDYFAGKNIDVLVIIRGGGSLESLQAFNNETLARKIANFNIPVICGIGHERDVPLASLTADLMVSTPTAVSVALNKSWEMALSQVRAFEQDIVNQYQRVLASKKHRFEILSFQLGEKVDFVFERFAVIEHQLNNKLETITYALKNAEKTIIIFQNLLLNNFQERINKLVDYLKKTEGELNIVNPMRQLKLGYSITSVGERIIRSVKQIKAGDEIDTLVSDGKIKSQVNNINK